MQGLEREITYWGKLLFERRLISGWGGNISCRTGKSRFLITGQHAPLGFLNTKDLVRIDSKGRPLKKNQQTSSETPLHLAVYKGTEAKAIIHAHPPMVLAFSLAHRTFVPLSFEEKYTLGEVSILPQETPTVIETDRVVDELHRCPIAILQGHGTVAVGKNLREAFLLTDLLEEAVHCQFFKNETEAPRDPESHPADTQKPEGSDHEQGYVLFSREHMTTLVESANSDPEFLSTGKEYDLTATMTFHLEEPDTFWTIHFAEGEITRLETKTDGEFLISGKRTWWEAIFQGRLDPFLATQQGKLKLERGELWKLSRWFKPFQRAFTLWQRVPIRPIN
ncbi:MAG: class II aldolase/adducin family protein [Candidatus Binatia bacterium]